MIQQDEGGGGAGIQKGLNGAVRCVEFTNISLTAIWKQITEEGQGRGRDLPVVTV